MRNIFNGLYDRLFILTVVKNHYGDKFLLLHLELNKTESTLGRRVVAVTRQTGAGKFRTRRLPPIASLAHENLFGAAAQPS